MDHTGQTVGNRGHWKVGAGYLRTSLLQPSQIPLFRRWILPTWKLRRAPSKSLDPNCTVNKWRTPQPCGKPVSTHVECRNLRTSEIVMRSFGFLCQHLVRRFHNSVVKPSAFEPSGRAGCSPNAIMAIIWAPVARPHGDSPLNIWTERSTWRDRCPKEPHTSIATKP